MVHAAVKSHGNGLGQSCIIGRNGDFPYMGKMTGQVLQINAASGSKEKNSKSSHHYQDHGEYYSGVLADHTAGMEKTVGKLIHFQSHLLNTWRNTGRTFARRIRITAAIITSMRRG